MCLESEHMSSISDSLGRHTHGSRPTHPQNRRWPLSQVSIEGLLQLTVLADGSVQIDLAGKHVEVERNGVEYVVRHEVSPTLKARCCRS
jgi:hypothetical protein